MVLKNLNFCTFHNSPPQLQANNAHLKVTYANVEDYASSACTNALKKELFHTQGFHGYMADSLF
jgi:hypothetical protein